MEKDHLEILLEDIRGKFELVLEGHESLSQVIRQNHQESNEKHDHTALLIRALNDKIDGVDARLDLKIDSVEHRLNQKIDSVEHRLNQKIDSVEHRLGKKIDAVAADLSEHRRDTEAHRKGWRVKEGE
jgi:hypothetical protein